MEDKDSNGFVEPMVFELKPADPKDFIIHVYRLPFRHRAAYRWRRMREWFAWHILRVAVEGWGKDYEDKE